MILNCVMIANFHVSTLRKGSKPHLQEQEVFLCMKLTVLCVAADIRASSYLGRDDCAFDHPSL